MTIQQARKKNTPQKSVSAQIMAVINLSPDSFSEPLASQNNRNVLAEALLHVEQGADIIDIGAESTRPGSKPISLAEELERLGSTVSSLHSGLPENVCISVDTYKAQTARNCLELGASIINDVSAMRADREMVHVIKDFAATVILMYSKERDSHPHASLNVKDYADPVQSIIDFLERRVEFALKHGIAPESIILDPGMGAFISTDSQYSWQVLRNFELLSTRFAPIPVMVATSRKGFLGDISGLENPSERDPISQLSALSAVLRGAKIIRTHNPAMARHFLDAARLLALS